MKGIAFSAWFVAVVCAVLGGCAAGAVSGKAAAPIGSWKGSLVTFNLGSGGRAFYGEPGVTEFRGRWEWLPATQADGVVVLTSSAPNSADRLRFSITWLNKNELRFCDANDHCDTLSRLRGGTSGIAPEPPL